MSPLQLRMCLCQCGGYSIAVGHVEEQAACVCYLFLYIYFIYLTVPGLSRSIQTFSCGMYYLVLWPKDWTPAPCIGSMES